MTTPLEKARKDPESMKARILDCARRIFGEYGFHGTTTRMIAQEVGIDISTLHYHWGGKKDLYESVVVDINKDLRQKLIEVEKVIHGLPLSERLDISIDLTTDYLFEHPEISNLILFRYFGKTRSDGKHRLHHSRVHRRHRPLHGSCPGQEERPARDHDEGPGGDELDP